MEYTYSMSIKSGETEIDAGRTAIDELVMAEAGKREIKISSLEWHESTRKDNWTMRAHGDDSKVLSEAVFSLDDLEDYGAIAIAKQGGMEKLSPAMTYINKQI